MFAPNNSVTALIKTLVERYGWQREVTPQQINVGLCDQFALDILVLVGGGPATYTLCTEEIVCDDRDYAQAEWPGDLILTSRAAWSKTALDAYGYPTSVLLENIRLGGQVWLFHEGMHSDAECPEGVANFFDLPINKRLLEQLGG